MYGCFPRVTLGGVALVRLRALAQARLLFCWTLSADTFVWTDLKDSGLDGTGQIALRRLLAHTTATDGPCFCVLAHHRRADFSNNLLAFNLSQPTPPPLPHVCFQLTCPWPLPVRSDCLVRTPRNIQPAPVSAWLPQIQSMPLQVPAGTPIQTTAAAPGCGGLPLKLSLLDDLPALTCFKHQLSSLPPHHHCTRPTPQHGHH